MYLKVPQQMSHERGDDVDESGGASAEKWPTRTGPSLALEVLGFWPVEERPSTSEICSMHTLGLPSPFTQ